MIQHKKTIIIGANATAERRFFTVVWPQDRLFIVEMYLYIHIHIYIYKLCWSIKCRNESSIDSVVILNVTYHLTKSSIISHIPRVIFLLV
jgi:hypothetical protein